MKQENNTVCPKCGSDNIFWDVYPDHKNEDQLIIWGGICDDCECAFTQYFKYYDTQIKGE